MLTTIVVSTEKPLPLGRGSSLDDMKHNVDPWNEKGGIGILHKNTKDTLNQLREILT